MSSQLRLPYYQLSAEAMQAFIAVRAALAKSSLGIKFIELIFMRVSQLNGCAYCLDKHSKALRDAGETNERLDTLAGWRLSPHFTDGEKAALAWVEAVTFIAASHAADEVYLPLKNFFTEAEISDLTFAISLMNGFNRLAISMKQ